jgi:hypothetical protein
MAPVFQYPSRSISPHILFLSLPRQSTLITLSSSKVIRHLHQSISILHRVFDTMSFVPFLLVAFLLATLCSSAMTHDCRHLEPGVNMIDCHQVIDVFSRKY